MATTRAEQDAKRFQAWQTDALESRPPSTELLEVGPFKAIVPAATDAGAWVTLIDADAGERETISAVTRLRAIFKGRSAPIEIEFNEALYPQVGRWLEAAGLRLSERNPLMACHATGFKPFAAPAVALHRLTVGSSADDLRAFQSIRWTNGGDNTDTPPTPDALRKELVGKGSVHVLAWLDGARAGTGVSHSLRGAVEIVGVVTVASMRRHGVAATITSDLLRRHFDSGGDFAFLDAANDEAARVYERLGFRAFGANLVYR